MSQELESIQDIFGQEILPGSLLAIRRKGRGMSLELSIVTKFDYRGERWSKAGRFKNGTSYGKVPQEIARIVRIRWGSSITEGWINLDRGYNDNIIVVQPGQAFLGLNNSKIKNILKVVDIAKDKKLLPDDYKLGTPISDEQIFPEIIK